ncbi:MAG: OsmC family protein [Proteobacteria bacterium]|nr:OsmC family protein [Pseudomonadota bacterium]
MTTESSTLTWREGMTFDAESDGFPLVMDASEAGGGRGLGTRPKPLLMSALAGCTAMDVAAVMRKMRIEPASFEVSAEGDIADEHPRRYLNARITYRFEGDDLPLDKLRKGIALSRDKYCAISATLRRAMPLSEVMIVNGVTHEVDALEQSA